MSRIFVNVESVVSCARSVHDACVLFIWRRQLFYVKNCCSLQSFRTLRAKHVATGVRGDDHQEDVRDVVRHLRKHVINLCSQVSLFLPMERLGRTSLCASFCLRGLEDDFSRITS